MNRLYVHKDKCGRAFVEVPPLSVIVNVEQSSGPVPSVNTVSVNGPITIDSIYNDNIVSPSLTITSFAEVTFQATITNNSGSNKTYVIQLTRNGTPISSTSNTITNTFSESVSLVFTDSVAGSNVYAAQIVSTDNLTTQTATQLSLGVVYI
jgi:hypothetical protein